MNELLKQLNLKFEFEELAENALNGYVDNDEALDRIRELLTAFDDAPEIFISRTIMSKNVVKKTITRMIPKDRMMVEFTAISLTYREDEKRVIIHNVSYKDRRVTQSEWDEISKIAANES